MHSVRPVSFEPFEVPVKPLSLGRHRAIAGEAATAAVEREAQRLGSALAGHTIWNLNSAGSGGGVAEMLPPLLGYAKGLGIDARWLVIRGDAEFFAITKRIHNWLHGAPGDGGLLGRDELQHFVAVNEENFRAMAHRLRPGDLALVHDPQPAGLIPSLRAFGVSTAWRCHIGLDAPNDLVKRAWEFLRPTLLQADAFCFSRASYAPPYIDSRKMFVIPPSIDPFAAKNEDLDDETVRSIVAHLGVVASTDSIGGPLSVRRADGSVFVMERHADILHAGPLPGPKTPLVVQVSRWDRLKDMPGVLRGFAQRFGGDGAHLLLVGPSVHGVADDPEGAESYDRCADEWRRLPHFQRCQAQLVCLPMVDVDENALMVNALQRAASVIVQKSLQEGFGLTVTEAMWKGRAVLASAVGGIQDQIEDGYDGRLLRDPTDLAAFGDIVDQLLADPAERARLGKAARDNVIHKFLATRHLPQLAQLVTTMLRSRAAERDSHASL